jgi:hypothetical protein
LFMATSMGQGSEDLEFDEVEFCAIRTAP